MSISWFRSDVEPWVWCISVYLGIAKHFKTPYDAHAIQYLGQLTEAFDNLALQG